MKKILILVSLLLMCNIGIADRIVRSIDKSFVTIEDWTIVKLKGVSSVFYMYTINKNTTEDIYLCSYTCNEDIETCYFKGENKAFIEVKTWVPPNSVGRAMGRYACEYIGITK